MNAPLPLGHPWPTTLYLALYMVTLSAHFLLMHYVVAGVLYTAWCAGSPRKGALDGPLVSLIRDWLPLMLGGAITAGVAPLLFVQILYQKHFYNANLLLFHRWMAVLIAAFYALYLMKTSRFARWPRAGRAALAAATLGLLGFIGWSWTENHLLSIQENAWVEQFAGESWFYAHGTLLPRALFWLCNTVPTLAMMLAWQRRYQEKISEGDEVEDCSRRLAIVAVAGSVLIIATAGFWAAAITPGVREAVTGSPNVTFVVMLAIGMAVEVAGWAWVFSKRRLRGGALLGVSVGTGLRIFSIVGLREAIRLAHIDIAALYPRHAAAAEVGGLGLFLLILVINTLLIAASIWLVRRGWREE